MSSVPTDYPLPRTYSAVAELTVGTQINQQGAFDIQFTSFTPHCARSLLHSHSYALWSSVLRPLLLLLRTVRKSLAILVDDTTGGVMLGEFVFVCCCRNSSICRSNSAVCLSRSSCNSCHLTFMSTTCSRIQRTTSYMMRCLCYQRQKLYSAVYNVKTSSTYKQNRSLTSDRINTLNNTVLS